MELLLFLNMGLMCSHYNETPCLKDGKGQQCLTQAYFPQFPRDQLLQVEHDG